MARERLSTTQYCEGKEGNASNNARRAPDPSESGCNFKVYSGSRGRLISGAGAASLKYCTARGRIVEVDQHMLDDA